MIRLRLSDIDPSVAAQGNGNAAGPFGGQLRGGLPGTAGRGGRVPTRTVTLTLAGRRRGQRDASRPQQVLWSKQFYHYDVDKWLEERGSDPFKPTRKAAPRNEHWHHMYNGDVISMPDKWEYPWYAAWDLAFHVLALTLVDPDFGKHQLKLMLRERYMHPNGQIPAYEWNFGDVNPPVHAWSTIFTYRLESAERGEETLGMAQELLSRSCYSTSRGGSIGRTAPVGTSSREASLASTISASSTATPRCRPAGISNRRTALPGWRCSARTCWRSPSSWR